MQIKIVSDGTPQGTNAVDRVTGEVLSDIVQIEWRIDVAGTATATLHIMAVPVEVEAEVTAIKGLDQFVQRYGES